MTENIDLKTAINEIDALLINNPDMKGILWDLLNKGCKGNVDFSDLLSDLEIIFGEDTAKSLFTIISKKEDSISEINKGDFQNKEYLKSLIIYFSPEFIKLYTYETLGPYTIIKTSEMLDLNKIDFIFDRADGERFNATFDIFNLNSFLEYFLDQYKELVIYNNENNTNFNLNEQKTIINQYREYVDEIVKDIEKLEEVE